jgi:hypothetical protein
MRSDGKDLIFLGVDRISVALMSAEENYQLAVA